MKIGYKEITTIEVTYDSEGKVSYEMPGGVIVLLIFMVIIAFVIINLKTNK